MNWKDSSLSFNGTVWAKNSWSSLRLSENFVLDKVKHAPGLLITALLLLAFLASGCEVPFSMPASVNLHRTAPRLEGKHVKVGGQTGSHLNLTGDIRVKKGAINDWEADEDDFQIRGGDLFLLWQIARNVDVGFTFDASEDEATNGGPFGDETESWRTSRGYHLSSQVVVLQPLSEVCVSVIPEFAYYTTDHNLENLTDQETSESDGEGVWVRLPLLIGLQTNSDFPIGASLMMGPDIIYAEYEISTRLTSFSGGQIANDNQDFSQVIPGWHLLAAVRIYFLEAFLEGWIFFPEHFSFQPVPGMSIGLSLTF